MHVGGLLEPDAVDHSFANASNTSLGASFFFEANLSIHYYYQLLPFTGITL